MSSRWLAKGFVAADVVSFLVQAAGGGMIAGQDDADAVSTGQHVYMGGIGIQLFFVVIFVVITVAFWRRVDQIMQTAGLRRDATWVRP